MEAQQSRLEAAAGITFRECATAYCDAHAAGWGNAKHAAQWRSTLEQYAAAEFGNLAVQGIDTGIVLRALEKIWTAKPETASRVRQRIEAVLDWATVRSYRTGDNPARWRGHLDKVLPKHTKLKKVTHHAALPWREMGWFMADLRQHDGIAARSLEFTILTATRTGEAINTRWDEIDPGARTWTVPTERMKAKREHRVPLSHQAVALLQALPRTGEHVFPGMKHGRPISNMAMLVLLRRMECGALTVHGFRSTFRDWCAEATNYPRELAESALAHVLTNKVEAAYQRGDLFAKRAKLMQAWADWCDRREATEVTPMRKAHVHSNVHS